MWTELVQVYESKLAVLEEARHAYEQAMNEVVSAAGLALSRAAQESIDSFGDEFRQTHYDGAVSDDSVFPGAPWPYVSITDQTETTEFRLTTWVPSAFGGPPGFLRLGLALQRIRPGLNLKAWVARCFESMPEGAPGERFEPLDTLAYADMGTSEILFRVVSIPLKDRQTGDVAREVHAAALELTGYILPLFEPIADAGHPIEVVEEALLAYRPTLEARAAEAGVSVSPAKRLGPWSGGRYLQVEGFWLASLPSITGMVACSTKAERDVVADLAERLGRPVGRDGILVLLSEEELRDPETDCEASISEAFDLWFATRAAAGEPGPLADEAAE